MALANKVAIVTGGAQGIGYSTSQQLLKAGAKVTVIDISEEVLSQSCKLLSDDYGADRVLGYPCDITNKQLFEKAFERTKEQFGSIDILVNNAGICNLTDWEKNLLVNLHGTMFGAYKAIDYMSTQKGGNGGVIINVASVIGVLPVPLANGSYSVSKSGIIAFSRSLPHLQQSDGIRMNCVCPTAVPTHLTKTIRDDLEAMNIKTDLSADMVGGFTTPEYVAEGILKLITDVSLDGKVMIVSASKGHAFQEFEKPNC